MKFATKFNYYKIILLTLLLFTVRLAAQQYDSINPPPAFPPGSVTMTQDRDQMMYQLGIKFPVLPPKLQDTLAPPNTWPVNSGDPEGNWTDSAGNTITRSGFSLWNNYNDFSAGFFPGPDSEKVSSYTPIDLLKMNNGTVITTEDQWWNERRPELLKDVQEQLWGVIPPDSILPDVTWIVSDTLIRSGFSAYRQKIITGNIDVSGYPAVRDTPKIAAYLRIPAFASGPVPVFIIFSPFGAGYGFGNFNLFFLDNYWNIIGPKGYGVCIIDPTMLQPDNGRFLTSYLIGLCSQGNWRKPTDWGTLAAWSWGVSRLVDYFETDPDVNADQLGLSGHSRYGKATLVAMAYDERIAFAFPSCSGSLGTKMNRRHWGQDLENSSWDQEYHWTAGNFFKWMGPLNPDRYLPRKIENCPVDAHSLLSLCAPRPVFINGGNGDTWTDPYGMYLTCVGATPVYELLGVDGVIMNDAKPQLDAAYISGQIAYRYHDGGHTDVPDWPAVLEFADKYFDVSFGSIQIDGERDNFYNTLAGPDNGYLQLKNYHGNDNGVAYSNTDLSADIWAAWDSVWFYLYAEVTDDTVSGSGDNSYQSDGLELKIDPIPTSTANSIFGPNLTILDSSDENVGNGWDNLNSIDDSLKQYAKRTLEGGYTLELAIRWDAILSGSETISAEVDSTFGLAINIHDNDHPVDGSREHTIQWAAVLLDNVWNTPANLGTVKFLPDHKLQFIPASNINGATNNLPYDGTEFYIDVDGSRDRVYNVLRNPDEGYLRMRSYANSDIGAPVNDADLSVNLWAGWDEEWFYIYEEVRDDTISGISSNANQNDALEVMFDPDPTDSSQTSTFQLRMTAWDSIFSAVESFTGLDSSDRKFARRQTSDGYALEMAVRWDAIELSSEKIVPEVDSVFGLAILQYDNDGNENIGSGGLQSSIMWAAVLREAASNIPKYLGTVMFLPDNKLKLLAENNMTGIINPVPYDGSDYTSVDLTENTPEIPAVYKLHQNYPNPFNPTTTITFDIPVQSHVKLSIYNILGQKVAELVNEVKLPGRYSVKWEASNYSSGVYLYKIEAGQFTSVKKLILLK